MKNFIIIILLLFCDSVNAQIALNDDFGNHANLVKSYIELNSVDSIHEYQLSNGISSNQSGVLISSNAYIAQSNIKHFTYNQSDRIHVFAGVNNLSQINNTLTNYDKNVLTVIAANSNTIINPAIHPKFDFAVNSCNVLNNNCANSYATGYSVGLIDKHLISQNVIKNGAVIKAAVINSLNDKLLDTNLLKRQFLIADTIFYNQNIEHTLLLDSLCDSIRVTLFYYDRQDNFNNLIDTVKVNNQKVHSNTSTYLYENTDFVKFNINSSLSDSLIYEYEYNLLFDTIIDTLQFVRISDSTAMLINKDSIQGIYSDTNKSITFLKRWQYGASVEIYNHSNIQLFDTLTLYRNILHFIKYDTIVTTFDNEIVYGIAYLPFYNHSFLPVELTNFNIQTSKETAFLKWQTLSEQNNSHFEIERSTNGVDFRNIARVDGKGSTVETSNYQYIDTSPENGNNYYRLKQFDFDGTFEYSATKVVHFDFVAVPDCEYYRLDGRLINNFKEIKGFYIEKCGDQISQHYQY